MTEKTASAKMIDLNVEEEVFTMKIINLDTDVFVEKAITALVFEIDGSGIYIAIALMN